MAPVAAASAMYGCSGSGGDIYEISDNPGSGGGNITIPADEKIHLTSLGNNCGGRCMIRAHMCSGVIKRFSSDKCSAARRDPVADPSQARLHEMPRDLQNGQAPVYPLMQKSYRGDPDGFVRVIWKEAFDGIAKKLKEMTGPAYPGTAPYTDPHYNDPAHKNYWGKTTIFCAGGSNTVSIFGHLRNFVNAIGARMKYRLHALSYPGIYHVDKLTVHSDMGVVVVNANRNRDMLNCGHLVLWGYNPGGSIQDNDSINRLLEASEKGIPITVINPQAPRTSKMLGCKHLGLAGRTDAALGCAILHYLIKKQLAETSGTGIYKDKWLDFNFIKAVIHGFFDNPGATSADFYPVSPSFTNAAFNSLDPRGPTKTFTPQTDPAAAEQHGYRVPTAPTKANKPRGP